eukprot:SAG31_NODE_27062_length_432_cov_0.576577_1_plen_116_part_00
MGPECNLEEHDITPIKKKLQPLVNMKLTQQTIEGLGCEYRKYKDGKSKRSTRVPTSTDVYVDEYKKAQHMLQIFSKTVRPANLCAECHLYRANGKYCSWCYRSVELSSSSEDESD